jgi:hypothetical protein
MKTIRVGSRSSCPSNPASRAAFTALRRCSAACVDFFARDLATLEEPPECVNGDGDAALPQLLLQFRSGMSALGGQGRKNRLCMRLDPLRMGVAAALKLGPDIALAPFLSPPPGRARRTDPTSLRRSTPQSVVNRANDTPAKVQPIRIWPCTPAPLRRPEASIRTKPIRESRTIQSRPENALERDLL